MERWPQKKHERLPHFPTTMFSIHKNNPKIVATLGPSTEDKEVIALMCEKGLSVARFNFSHGDHDTQRARLLTLETISKEKATSVITFADLSGPKVRIGQLEDGKCELREGEIFIITTETIVGNEKRASITYQDFTQGIVVGMTILLDDGKLQLQIESIEGQDTHTRVIRGGTLLQEKGVNVPEATWSLSSLTEKDKHDLHFILEQNYHALALSFVRKKEDIEEARAFMKERGEKMLPIITKLETRQAMHNLESIIEASDCVMVARGDLGVEIGIEHVPMHQKTICALAEKYNKPVIVATQLLESMVESPTPTRAEVSDVVTAITDGASYVMLSDETTIGKHPVVCVETLSTIIAGYSQEV